MVKINFGKNWQWYQDVSSTCNISERNVDTVYRIDANPCFYGSCKSNCSSNPYCLNGFGERRLYNLLQKESSGPIEKNCYFRKPEEFVGLVNLGATCYINAYLQVWFNNYFFRESILGLNLKKLELEDNYVEDNLTNKSSKIPELCLKSNECLASNLQMLFTLMNDTIRKSIDPSFFVKALGLDENIQQDAQEFSQLFLSLIQSILASTSDINPSDSDTENLYPFRSSSNSDLIHDLFQGEYKYVTECNNCKLQSIRNSNFFELTLNIQNSQTINDCINELLDEEQMQGDNQYFCDNCKHKTDATRRTKVSCLPPILNLQLLRFVYDRNSGLKKKLSNKVKFSEILDLSSLVEENKPAAYHLGAILMHVGKTAYSGHYTAQVKKFQTNEWFNFNDEIITKIKKKNLLGQSTEDGFENAEKSEKCDSNEKKGFSSSNAYLLVYYRSDLIEKIPKENLVRLSKQSEIVQVDNQLLENWFNNLNSDSIDQKEIENNQRTLIHSIYENLWLNKSQKKSKSKDLLMPVIEEGQTAEKELYYFVPTDFLRKLMAGELTQIQNESNSVLIKYMCAHNRLNPFAINRYKLVSRKGLDILCEKSSSCLTDVGALEAFNNSTTRCWPCVFSCFEYLKFKEDIKQDLKKVRQMLKYEFDEQKVAKSDDEIIFIENGNYQDNKENRNLSDTWYWIGKESLKQWQNLAIKKLESQLPSVNFADLSDNKPDIIEEPNGNDNDIQELSSFPQSSANLVCSYSSHTLKYFNEDILCPHNNLAPGQNKRLVCSELWNQIFFKYFFKQDASESEQQNETESQSNNNSNNNKNFIFSNQSLECKICAKENEEHVNKKAQVKNQKEILPDLYFNRNRPLISELQPEKIYYVIMTDFVKEWRALIKNSKFKNIQIFNQILLCQHGCLPFDEKTIDYSMSTLLTEFEWEFISNNYSFDTQIKIIMHQNLHESKEAQLNYEFLPQVCKECLAQNQLDKIIFENKKILIRLQDEEENGSVSKFENSKSEEIEDTDIIHISSKKARYSINEDGTDLNTNGKQLTEYIPTRRSKRSRRSKKDLEVVCSSYTPIKLIKQNIASQISRLISEQHLFFNNIELDNDKSLLDYKINKGDLLQLKLDKIDSSMEDDSSHYEMAHVPEVGFKGSNLIKYN